ncbi:hypothetical protein M378DRAFT_28858 [Amanita muscaria Koide BX008]|uniref:RNA-binding protein vts1-like alpha-helical domain-containing protein n=1 Tax=Amanita muscaria (strain Koide BX008) TaxID=946122 RepID=A0A0C2WCM3_AMAMK|nr:hypothetical protein M378DRAFT_28858 [Amanita muscaria Koide BX008]
MCSSLYSPVLSRIMSLRPHSTSPSPSPDSNEAGKISARQSMSPQEELVLSSNGSRSLLKQSAPPLLYSLLQHYTQVQIRLFITVLQQLAGSDPMMALLSLAMGGSMQSQMEAKLASIA